jgi:hypothetical protein
MDRATHTAAPVHLSPDPQQLASIAYDRFAAASALAPHDERLDILVYWEEEIRCRLHDEELRNPAARTLFEARIVARLAGGWQPGSDALFCAATLVFHWKQERQRLAALGQAGLFVSHAIDERASFDAQHEPERSLHRKVMARLANPAPPAYYQMERYMFHVEMLAQRFPHLLAICVNAATVAHWRAEYAGLYAATPQAPCPPILAAVATLPPQPGAHGFARLLHRMFGCRSSS